MSDLTDRLRALGEQASPMELTDPRHVKFSYAPERGESFTTLVHVPADAAFIVAARNLWPHLTAVAEAAVEQQVIYGGGTPRMRRALRALAAAVASLPQPEQDKT